jgi:DNA repair exonuclease SbcCD ATPase subunit
MKVSTYRIQLERLKGERDKVSQSITNSKNTLRTLKQDIRRHQQAREVIRQVGLHTQQKLQYYISDISSLALYSVLDDPYELSVEFVERRNKTECDLYFVQDGHKIDPIAGSGVGAIDVAAFALRIASYTMKHSRSRNVVILDEPFRYLSEDLQPRAARMVKELSERLEIQFIIVTHEQALTEHADKTFRVTIKKGVSHVREE